MKKTTAISCVFLDIGSVLLTDGWDHLARKRAAKDWEFKASFTRTANPPELAYPRYSFTLTDEARIAQAHREKC
jgi:hypothetical protein